MDKVARGDTDAFRKLYDRYKRPIMSYAFYMVKSQSVAEEVTQETFLKVYRARESYTREAKFTTWLWAIARNVAIDHLRKKSELPLSEEFAETLPAPEAGTEALDAASREQVAEALTGLSEAQREAVSLRTFSELSYEEIASAMEISVSAVKNHLHRAKAALIKKIGGKEKS